MDGRRDREPGALGVSHVDDDDAIGAKGAKDFATPGSMSVDTPAQKKKDDDWWGDESWHGSGSWDAHGWDAWYRGTPSSWDGWGWGGGSWSAGEWQASSVQWGRRGAVDSLSAPEIKAEETQPDLETLLERAYDNYGESDSQAGSEAGSLRSLDSATTLVPDRSFGCKFTLSDNLHAKWGINCLYSKIGV